MPDRSRNPGYCIAWRIDQRAAQAENPGTATHARTVEPTSRDMASLAESGQQTPIVVVRTKDNGERYLVIDGYKRIAVRRQLGRDTVEATVWPMGEAEALLLSRSQRMSRRGERPGIGWLLLDMEQRFGYSLDELARHFDRSTSWVSRRLAPAGN